MTLNKQDTEALMALIMAIGSGETDGLDILCKIAASDPSVLLKAAGIRLDMDSEIRRLNGVPVRDGGGYVNAIKHVRNVKGWGLKEAKVYVDGIWDRGHAGRVE